MPAQIINDGQWFGGLDSISYSLGIGAYQWAQNVSNRGGIIQTRQGVAQIQKTANKKGRGIALFPIANTDKQTIVVAIDDKIYQLKYPYTGDLVEIPNLSFPTQATTRDVHFELTVQAQKTLDDGTIQLLPEPKFILIIQDGTTHAGWWDGATAGMFSPDDLSKGIVVADYMKWVGDRLWLAKGRKLYAGDQLNPTQMTETSITASGGFFLLPADVTGLGVTHDFQTLLAFTDQTTTAFQVGILDRTQWPNTQDFQTVIFPGIGCASHRTIINQYGMTWWMSHDGVMGLDNALQTYQTSRMQVRDQNMSRSKEGIKWTTGGGCAGTYGNNLFFSVPSGSRYNQHTWLMDQGVVDTLNIVSPPAWCSNWTGIRPEQWVTGTIQGQQRCFCISNDAVPAGIQATIWEAFIGQRMDVPQTAPIRGDSTPIAKDIACAFETKFYTVSPVQYCRFRWAELDLAEINGRVDLQVYYCGRRTSYKKILDKTILSNVSTNTDQEFIPSSRLGAFVPQYRTVRSVTDTVDEDDQDSGVQTPYVRKKDREFSLLVTWTGQMAITGCRILIDTEGDYIEGRCEEEETEAREIDSDGTGRIIPLSIFNPDNIDFQTV